MADQQYDKMKKSSPNRKKRKNKSSKRKSDRSVSSRIEVKLNSSKDEKNTSIREISNDDCGNAMFKSDRNEQQDSYGIKDAAQSYGNKYKHNSSDFNTNGYFPSSFENHADIDFRENLGSDRKSSGDPIYTNSANPFCLLPPDNLQYTVQDINFITDEINFLRQENLRLTDILEKIYREWDVQIKGEVDIIFKKRSLSEKFSSAVNELLSCLLSGEIKVEELEKFCKEFRKSPEPECLFALDSSADLSLNSSIPVYDASFEQILESPNDNKIDSPQKAGRPPKNCFNCDGNHHMSVCPYKLNFRKIANARKQARSNFVPSVRYHVYGKNETDFKPGMISNELREALGLESNQIPLHVYRMRVLGYPPGWLHEAAVESSGMILYDSEGNALKEENTEDGEVDTSAIRVQYDPDKLNDYPGFNVPLPPNLIEEGETHGLPPLQPDQLRNVVEKFMSKPNVRPSRKRKINLPSDKPRKIQRLEEDMEIENDSDNDGRIEITNDFIPPLPENNPPSLPPPPPPADDGETSEDMTSKTPSLPPPPPPPPADDGETSEDMTSKFFINTTDENSASFCDSAETFSRLISCSEFSSGTSSPSLADLEELKKKLVLQLGNDVDDELCSEPSSNPPCDDESSLNAVIDDDDKTLDGCYVLDECVASDLSNLSTETSLNSELNDPDLPGNSSNNCELLESSLDKSDLHETSHSLQRTTSQSKCVVFGTPSLTCHSPFSKLPDYDNFSKDVSAHLPFENLPNSTGTYAKMKNVLKKVKDKLNLLMN